MGGGVQQVSGGAFFDGVAQVFNAVKGKVKVWMDKIEISRIPPLPKEATHLTPVGEQWRKEIATLTQARAEIDEGLIQQGKDGNEIISPSILKLAGLLAINRIGISYLMNKHPIYYLILAATTIYLIVATAICNNTVLNNMEPRAKDICAKQRGYRTFYRSFVCRFRDAATPIQVAQPHHFLGGRVGKRPEHTFDYSVEKKLRDLAPVEPRHIMRMLKRLNWGLLLGAITILLCMNVTAITMSMESHRIPSPPTGFDWKNCTILGYPPVLTCYAMW